MYRIVLTQGHLSFLRKNCHWYMKDTQILLFYEERFQPPVPFQRRKLFSKMNLATQGLEFVNSLWFAWHKCKARPIPRAFSIHSTYPTETHCLESLAKLSSSSNILDTWADKLQRYTTRGKVIVMIKIERDKIDIIMREGYFKVHEPW